MKTLNRISLAFVLLAFAFVAYIWTHRPAGLTVVLEEVETSYLEPDMTVYRDGAITPQFEAWAISELQKGRR